MKVVGSSATVTPNDKLRRRFLVGDPPPAGYRWADWAGYMVHIGDLLSSPGQPQPLIVPIEGDA